MDKGQLFFQPFWRDSSIVGYVDGREAARLDFTANPYLAKLDVRADDAELYCDRVDETRVVCVFRDTDGMRMLHHFGVAKVSTEGDIELIGPDVLPSLGGTVAFWVKTRACGRRGEARITVDPCHPNAAPETVVIRLI